MYVCSHFQVRQTETQIGEVSKVTWLREANRVRSQDVYLLGHALEQSCLLCPSFTAGEEGVTWNLALR